MTKPFSYCEYRGCKKFLRDEYDKWFLTDVIDHRNEPHVYCEKHYDIKLRQVLKKELL